MKNKIIGRENEIERLKQYIDSDQSEFIAIYGRRRVGKTFLIKELFENQFVFRTTGKENANMQQQLLAFSNAMSDYFDGEYTFNNWSEAFRALSKAIE
ncbi:MAG: ATP-binding protein, partial [Bacteroidales bacterium]|nr:ATP-binding protein [Bacteroidales bacterium]